MVYSVIYLFIYFQEPLELVFTSGEAFYLQLFSPEII